MTNEAKNTTTKTERKKGISTTVYFSSEETYKKLRKELERRRPNASMSSVISQMATALLEALQDHDDTLIAVDVNAKIYI